MCLLSNDVHDYYNVAQGKITIPNVDDGEECQLTDVSGHIGRNLYLCHLKPNSVPVQKYRTSVPSVREIRYTDCDGKIDSTTYRISNPSSKVQGMDFKNTSVMPTEYVIRCKTS